MGGMFDLQHPNQNYIRSAGHLGWAFPASLGAKCALPDRPVICFTGDAGFWYHIAEIEVAVRWSINTIVVVNNNSGGNQSKRGFDRAYGGEQTAEGRQMWTFNNVNFAEIAQSIGAVGIRVEKAADIQTAIKKALQLNKPVIIDVVTDIVVMICHRQHLPSSHRESFPSKCTMCWYTLKHYKRVGRCRVLIDHRVDVECHIIAMIGHCQHLPLAHRESFTSISALS